MSLDYFDDGSFIPVELPERAVHNEDELKRPKFLSSKCVSEKNLRDEIVQSPQQPYQGSPHYPWSTDPLSSTRSPCSEISCTSDDSISIIGDIFSAPTRLRDIMNKFTHIRDAGDQYYWPSLLPTATSDSPSSGKSANDMNSASPFASPGPRPLPTPSSLHQSVPLPSVGNQLSARNSLPFSPFLSVNRIKTSPKGPRNQVRQPDGSPNMSRNQRRNRYRNRDDKGLAPLNSLTPPKATKPNHSAGTPQTVEPNMLFVQQRQSASQTPISTLNPFAPSFDPGQLPRPRAHSLPEDSFSRGTNLNEAFDSHVGPLQGQLNQSYFPVHRQSLPSLPFIAPQKLQTIRQDLPHLREWSSQFGMASNPVVDDVANRLQAEQHYHSLQRYAFPLVNQVQRQFPYDIPPPAPFNNCGPHFGAPPHGPTQYYPPGVRYPFPYDDTAAHTRRIGFNEGHRHMPPRFKPPPLLTPVELPETGVFSHPLLPTDPITHMKDATGHSNNNGHFHLEAPQKVEVTKVSPLGPPQIDLNGLRSKSVSPGLVERGKSVLTPVTELSEISSSNKSLITETDLVNEDDASRDPVKKKRSNRRSKKPSGMTYMQDHNTRRGDKRGRV